VKVKFLLQDLLKKQKMSRYKFQQLSNFDMRRINAFFFNRAKYIRVDEISTICDILECDVSQLIKYTPTTKRKKRVEE